RVYQAWSRRTTSTVATTAITMVPRRAAIVPPPLPTAKPVTSAMATMMRISLLASSRKADVAGSSTRMKTSSWVRYDCRTSSGVGRIRERSGWRRAGPAPRLAAVVPAEAREELRTAVDHIGDKPADVAEERPNCVRRAGGIPVDEHDDEGNCQPDEPLSEIDRHRPDLPRRRRCSAFRLGTTLTGSAIVGQPAHL